MPRPRLKPGNGRKRRRQMIRPPVAAMGDIAFLLIIFFIVASNFIQNQKINPELPDARQIEQLERRAITVAIDEEEKIYLNGNMVGDPEAVKWGVQAMIEARGPIEEGDQSPQARAQRTVMFRCDRKVDRSVFEPVMEAITEAGGIIAAEGERGG